MHSSLRGGKLFYRHPLIPDKASGYNKMLCRGIRKLAPSNDLQLSVQADLEKLIDLKAKNRAGVAELKLNSIALDVYFDPLGDFYKDELEKKRKGVQSDIVGKRIKRADGSIPDRTKGPPTFNPDTILPPNHGLDEETAEKFRKHAATYFIEALHEWYSDEIIGLQIQLSELQKKYDIVVAERDGMLTKFGESGKFASEVALQTCLDHFEKTVDCKSEAAKTDLMRRVRKVIAKIGGQKLHASVSMATIKSAVTEIAADRNSNEHKYLLRDAKRFFALLSHPTLANGLGLQNPAVAIKPGAPTKKRSNETMSPFLVLEEEKLSAYWKALVAVLGFSGMRLTESASLEWKNIDFENELIHLRANAYYPELKTWERPIKPFTNVWKFLKAYKKVARHADVVFDRVLVGVPRKNSDNPTWIEMREDKPRAINLPKALADALEDATGKTWPEPALRLRRYWVTQMRLRKLNSIESLMGGHSEETAEDHYQNALEVVKKAKIGEIK